MYFVFVVIAVLSAIVIGVSLHYQRLVYSRVAIKRTDEIENLRYKNRGG